MDAFMNIFTELETEALSIEHAVLARIEEGAQSTYSTGVLNTYSPF